MPRPAWLHDIKDAGHDIPITSLLRNCVYYPAAGLDGDPVKYLGRYYQSFVYTDYGVGRDAVMEKLSEFSGYQLFALRDVRANELFHGEDLAEAQAGMDLPERKRIQNFLQPPFAIWAVLDRRQEISSDHGPDRFSLLYLGGDGVATFNALFRRHQVRPGVIAVIQPGTGFGGNWTDFESPASDLATAVRNNPAGMPKHFLYGGWGPGESYRKAPWPEYDTAGLTLHDRLRLFAFRNTTPSTPSET